MDEQADTIKQLRSSLEAAQSELLNREQRGWLEREEVAMQQLHVILEQLAPAEAESMIQYVETAINRSRSSSSSSESGTEDQKVQEEDTSNC